MEKSIPSPITDVMECEQLSSCSAQEVSQYVPVHRMTDTDSTNFHGSLWNRAQTAACLESTAGSWAIDRFSPSETSCQGADCTTFTSHEYLIFAKYMIFAMLSVVTLPEADSVPVYPHLLSSPSSRRRYVAISISRRVLMSSSMLYSLFWASMSERSCLNWASNLATASCIWFSW